MRIEIWRDKLLDDAGNKIDLPRYRLTLLADGSTCGEILRLDAKGDHAWQLPGDKLWEAILAYVCQRFAAFYDISCPTVLWSGRLLRKTRVVLRSTGKDGQVPMGDEVAIEHVVVDGAGVERWVDVEYGRSDLIIRTLALQGAVLALANRAGLL